MAGLNEIMVEFHLKDSTSVVHCYEVHSPNTAQLEHYIYKLVTQLTERGTQFSDLDRDGNWEYTSIPPAAIIKIIAWEA